MPVQIMGWEDPPEEGMATHSSILAWRIPWSEEPGGLQSTGSQRIRHDWSELAHMYIDTERTGRMDVSQRAGVPNLWDLRWSWCNNHRHVVHNRCNALGAKRLGNPAIETSFHMAQSCSCQSIPVQMHFQPPSVDRNTVHSTWIRPDHWGALPSSSGGLVWWSGLASLKAPIWRECCA